MNCIESTIVRSIGLSEIIMVLEFSTTEIEPRRGNLYFYTDFNLLKWLNQEKITAVMMMHMKRRYMIVRGFPGHLLQIWSQLIWFLKCKTGMTHCQLWIWWQIKFRYSTRRHIWNDKESVHVISGLHADLDKDYKGLFSVFKRSSRSLASYNWFHSNNPQLRR